MLRYVNIRNLAVIESLELSLQPGLNVLTGETGAGKSIVVGAVGLLLGGRASPDMIRTGEEIAIVQAIFEQDGREIVVRREVSSSGRSRSFVDDALVTATSLRELGARLVDIHGQHEHQTLLQPDEHLDLLDRWAGHADERAAVADAFARWQAAADELAAARRIEADREQRADYLRFQLQDIERASLVPGEDESLGALRTLLANGERLRRLSSEAYDRLYEGEGAVIETLAAVWKRVADLAQLDPRATPLLDGRPAVDAVLQDLASFLREYGTDIDVAPERLQDVEDRLAVLERLKRKYGPTLAEVLAKSEACRNDLAAIDSADSRLRELERSVATQGEGYSVAAARLSASRRRAAGPFAKSLETELASLAMERTRFEVRFAAAGDDQAPWTPRGTDVAEFYLSPNPGEELKPLARIASGGELSRIMLALKTLASTDTPGKTLVFDEVDAGIGGRVADVVGQRLRALGRTYQVLCITHLPQIAAAGEAHYRVAKSVRQARTTTSVEALGSEERVNELARMMAGSVLTDGARATAREMLAVREGESAAQAKGESESRHDRRKRKSDR